MHVETQATTHQSFEHILTVCSVRVTDMEKWHSCLRLRFSSGLDIAATTGIEQTLKFAGAELDIAELYMLLTCMDPLGLYITTFPSKLRFGLSSYCSYNL